MRAENNTQLVCVIQKDRVIAKLNEHKEKYAATIAELMAIYERQVERYKEAVDEHLAKKVKGETSTSPEEPTCPHDRTKTYNTWIGFLESTSEDTVELTISEYQKLMEDEWEFIRELRTHIWQTRAGGSNAMFLSAEDQSSIEELVTRY